MSEEDFKLCMRKICGGDKSALKAVYEAYISYVYTIIWNMVQNKEDAEDLTSEFFIKLWNQADRYRPGHGHRAYLAAIARNLSIDFLRKKRREIPTDAFHETDRKEDAQIDSVAEQVVEKEKESGKSMEEDVVSQMSVKKALSLLNSGEREVVHLKVIGEMTFQEIASVLQTPMGTITWRYQNAIKKLRRCGYEQGF